MARRSQSLRRGNRGRSMESVRWSGGTFFFNAISAGNSALVFLTASNDPPETILRIRGELVAWIDGLEAPAVSIDVAVGVILVPEGSATTVQWSPGSEANAPWLMYERFSLGYEEYVTDVIDAPGLTVFRKTIDVKAQRIVRPDVEAQLAIENNTLSGAAAVNVAFTSRVLLGAT